MQFCKVQNIYDCIKNLSWAWSDVTKDSTTGIWKKTLKRFTHDFKGFAKEEKVAKISKVVVEMASYFNLGVDEDDIEEFVEVVPEELTNEELQELKQERIAEEEAREKETAGAEKEEHQRKFTMKSSAEAIADLSKLLKKSENTDPNTERFSLTDRNAHGALPAYKRIYDLGKKRKEKKRVGGGTNQANHHGHISEKSDISSRTASGKSFRMCSTRRHCFYTR